MKLDAEEQAIPGGLEPETDRELGDFTITPRVLLLAALAIPIGVVSTFLALGLLS